MFKDISLSDYDLSLDLERSYFLVDYLYEEISFDYVKKPVPDKKIYPYPLHGQVIINKKLDNGISEEISLDELIFYIQVTLPKDYKKISKEVLNKIDLIRQKHEPPRRKNELQGGPPEIVREQMKIYDNIQRAYKRFLSIFGTIDNIQKSVKNLEILFKYDKKFNSKEEEDDIMKELLTLNY